FLEVRPSNPAGIALYEDEGFNESGRRPRYYPADTGRREVASRTAMEPLADGGACALSGLAPPAVEAGAMPGRWQQDAAAGGAARACARDGERRPQRSAADPRRASMPMPAAARQAPRKGAVRAWTRPVRGARAGR